MTGKRKELIDRWAREAVSGQDWTGDDAAPYERFEFNGDGLERFASLVRADALEEAAKLADEDDHLSGTGDAIRKLIQKLTPGSAAET